MKRIIDESLKAILWRSRQFSRALTGKDRTPNWLESIGNDAAIRLNSRYIRRATESNIATQ